MVSGIQSTMEQDLQGGLRACNGEPMSQIGALQRDVRGVCNRSDSHCSMPIGRAESATAKRARKSFVSRSCARRRWNAGRI